MMNLTRLFLLHTIITLAAGVVLIVAPKLIPDSVDIQLNADANLVCYLLGACEVSLAALSYCGTKIKDKQALQLICLTFILLHGLTAFVEVYAYTQGTSVKIWGNVVLRIVVVGLFVYYGFIKQLEQA